MSAEKSESRTRPSTEILMHQLVPFTEAKCAALIMEIAINEKSNIRRVLPDIDSPGLAVPAILAQKDWPYRCSFCDVSGSVRTNTEDEVIKYRANRDSLRANCPAFLGLIMSD